MTSEAPDWFVEAVATGVRVTARSVNGIYMPALPSELAKAIWSRVERHIRGASGSANRESERGEGEALDRSY